MKKELLIGNERFEDGTTWLHIAAAKGFLEEVERMLAKGANPFVLDGQGKTPVDYADSFCKNILIKAAGKTNSFAVRRECVNTH